MPTNTIHLNTQKALAADGLAKVWGQLRADLIPDGLLRDIYVENTLPEDWRTFLHLLHAGIYRTEYRNGEQLLPLPRDPLGLVQRMEQAHLIRIDIGGLWLHCHCFCLEEIELDFDPAEVNNAEQAGKLIRFLAELTNALSRDVLVTHENFKQAVFLVMHADG